MPRKERNTKTHNIFLLSKEKVQEEHFNNEETTIEEAITKIVYEAGLHYEEQVLKDNLYEENFHIKLFFHKEEVAGNKLASFCKPFVKKDQDIVNFRTKSASSILFIWDEKHVFAITTGQGFRAIEEFCVPKFGMLVVSTFEKLFRITALDSNGMSSVIHSNKTIYANEIDFIDVDALDTIFKEVTGRLNSQAKVHDLLKLDKTSKKKSMKITAKNYVQFSSSLNFEGLLHLLKIISQYDYSNLQDNFNLIAPVSPKRNKQIVDKNNEKVIERMYDSITTGTSLGFDLFNRSTNDFISADAYELRLNDEDVLVTTDDIDSVEFMKEAYRCYLDGAMESHKSFSDFVNSVNLVAIKGDITVSDGKLLKHISGEIEVDGKNYYIFYGDFYFLSEAYSERLNKSLNGKLKKERFTHILKTKWESGDKEDDFNEKASNNEGYIHLHKVKPEYVEFADLLKIDENGITIVHVKDGFDDDMRALDRQVELSVTRILDLRNNNNDEYMRKLFQNASKSTTGRNITVDFPCADDFIKAMKEIDIHYIAAIRPPKKELIENRSNIAKHCLNALILRCFNQGVDLKINIL